MKLKALYILVFFTILCTLYTQAQQTYQLVWADEFNVNGSLNPTFWNIEINGNGGGNNELQYYTARNEKLMKEKHILRVV
jgi:hypothetical protein